MGRESEWWEGPLHDSDLAFGWVGKTLWSLCNTHGRALGLRSAHLILPPVYGPEDHFDEIRRHTLACLIDEVSKARRTDRPSLTIGERSERATQWLYIDDAGRAVIRFLDALSDTEHLFSTHPVYNVGSGHLVSMEHLAQIVSECADWRGEFSFDAAAAPEEPSRMLDGQRFELLTGFSPLVDLHEGIARTACWYDDHALESPPAALPAAS